MWVCMSGWLDRIKFGVQGSCSSFGSVWSSHVSGSKVLNTSLGMLKDAVGFRV